MLAALATAAAPIGVLQASPAIDLGASGWAWIAPASAAFLLAASALATVLALVAGLRGGSIAALLRAGGAAALAGGAVVALTAAGSLALPVLIGAVLVLASIIPDRAGASVPGVRGRMGLAVAVLVVAEGAVVVELLPMTAAAIASSSAPLLAAAAAFAGLAALVGAGTPSGAAAGLLAIGAAGLALDRGGGADHAIGLATLSASAVLTAWAWTATPRSVPEMGAGRLAVLAHHLAEGVLQFDGRLRLRSWNPAAAALLDLGPDAAGTRLEDLLGLTLGQLPVASETVRQRTPVGGIDLTISRHDDTMTVILHDPSVSSDVERLGRELRGTLEELLQARRTIELQRAELERATTTDRLTGVSSRQAILDRLRLEVAEARRYQHPVAAVLLDVDGFTAINTGQGIGVADDVLREIALRMRVRVREADALGRAGSGSFLALLPHTEAEGAATFADALRRRIADRPIQTGAVPLSVTVSIGVAIMHPGDDLDADALLARVTEALASAQRAGGDRIALDRMHGLARLDDARPGVTGATAAEDDEDRAAGA